MDFLPGRIAVVFFTFAWRLRKVYVKAQPKSSNVVHLVCAHSVKVELPIKAKEPLHAGPAAVRKLGHVLLTGAH